MPASVTASYLSTVLPMTQQSATNNLLRPLKRIGIVDQDNKPTDRAFKWRDDNQYPEACDEIRKEVYPQELIDAFSGPDVDRLAVERWFLNNARVGQNAASKLASFYLLLVKADLSQQEQVSKSDQGSAKTSNGKRASKKGTNSSPQDNNSTDSHATPQEEPIRQDKSDDGPSLHIDVQVYLLLRCLCGADRLDFCQYGKTSL